MKRFSEDKYDDYKKYQVSRSGKKWTCPPFWKEFDSFRKIAEESCRIAGNPDSICCMGIRNGNEYDGFKQVIGYKNTVMFGIDIHPDVEKVGPNCFCYDFSELPKEWEKKFSWVYSNSLDHAFDVDKTIKEWHRVCKDYMLLTLSSCGVVSHSDVYDFTVEDIPNLFSKDLFEVIKIWNGDKTFSVLLKIK